MIAINLFNCFSLGQSCSERFPLQSHILHTNSSFKSIFCTGNYAKNRYSSRYFAHLFLLQCHILHLEFCKESLSMPGLHIILFSKALFCTGSLAQNQYPYVCKFFSKTKLCSRSYLLCTGDLCRIIIYLLELSHRELVCVIPPCKFFQTKFLNYNLQWEFNAHNFYVKKANLSLLCQ